MPNAVCTCGGMKMGDRIVLPYAIPDTLSTLATIKTKVLLDKLEN
jgi:hypothetical protein